MRLTGGQLVVEMLKAHWVRHIFGVPGDTSLAFYDALCQAQEEITYVLTRDERSAATWPMSMPGSAPDPALRRAQRSRGHLPGFRIGRAARLVHPRHRHQFRYPRKQGGP